MSKISLFAAPTFDLDIKPDASSVCHKHFGLGSVVSTACIMREAGRTPESPRMFSSCILKILGDYTMDPLLVVIVLALAATVVAMLMGLLSMSGGGETDREFSTKLMWARVGAQVVTIVLLLVATFMR
jgi:hypothetical protein